MPITYRQHQDTRDGKIYNCVLMPDGKWWSAENLAWDGAGVYYNNDPALGAIYGRLYTWAEALVACPSGTHLPSDAEWTVLENAIPAPDGTKLKASSMLWVSSTGTDDYGFAVLPAGWATGSTFLQIRYESTLWTSAAYYLRSFLDTNTQVSRTTTNATWKASVRFIVDVFNEPHPLKLFGVNFDGFERGLTVKIQRPLQVKESIGGSVKLIPYGDARLDEWQVDAELWLKGEWAAQLEAAVPPYGVPADSASESAMYLPPRSGSASFPGLLPAVAGASADKYIHAQVAAFESQGRKGPAIDLFGYRLNFTLRTYGAGATTNPSITPSVTPPAWLPQKFAAHQIQDWSQSRPTITAGGFATTYRRVLHGRRMDYNLNLDHLSQERADELVAFFRGIREQAVTLTIDRGTAGIGTISVYLIGLELHRTGLLWDGTLETIAA